LTVVFAGGEGAPVGGDGGCGVLQHWCERGKLGLAPIWEWCSSEGAHRRGGRRRRRSAKSDVKEGPPVAVRAWERWGGRWRSRGRRGVGDEGVDEGGPRLNGLGRWRDREGKRRGEGGGVRQQGCHATQGWSWGLAPTGSGARSAGVCDVRRTVVAGRTEERRRGLTGGPRHSAGGGAADRRVRLVSGAWEREPRAQAPVGRLEKETEWPSPDEQYGFSFI
jgi:hypothetical protein